MLSGKYRNKLELNETRSEKSSYTKFKMSYKVHTRQTRTDQVAEFLDRREAQHLTKSKVSLKLDLVRAESRKFP